MRICDRLPVPLNVFFAEFSLIVFHGWFQSFHTIRLCLVFLCLQALTQEYPCTHFASLYIFLLDINLTVLCVLQILSSNLSFDFVALVTNFTLNVKAN